MLNPQHRRTCITQWSWAFFLLLCACSAGASAVAAEPWAIEVLDTGEADWVTLPAIPLSAGAMAAAGSATDGSVQNPEAVDPTGGVVWADGESVLAKTFHRIVPAGFERLSTGDYAAGGHGGHDWEFLPDELLYRSYAAGIKEPRMSTAWLYDGDRGWIWESTLGGRAGLVRFGHPGNACDNGFQLDVGGATYVRLDPEEERDVEAADFSAFVPLTYRDGPWAWKLMYYHVSSHLGDEFLLKNPGVQRFNYVRDSIVIGTSYDATDALRLYGELGYAFFTAGGAEPWEFQFGVEYVPTVRTGGRPVPFFAVNAHLREERNFGGYINVLAGAQWQGDRSNHQFRAGLQYYNGRAMQWSFFDGHEELIGLGIWYEY